MTEILKKIEKYQFWDRKPRDFGYPRRFYTDRIGKYIGNDLVKVVIGQRRVGKSYILRQIASSLIVERRVPVENVLYVSREFLAFAELETHEDLEALLGAYLAELKPAGRVYLFIDEIQTIAGWERFVNSHAQDFVSPVEIFVSGSNSNLLSGEFATLLSGRYVEFEVFPYCFAEWCGALALGETRESYVRFLREGGLPELVNLPDEEARRHYVESLKDTVMLRDLVSRYAIKDPVLLDDLFAYLVGNAANLVSIPNIVNYFKSRNRKTNYETVSNYLSHLSRAFLLHRAERFDIKGKEILAGVCKWYANDLAFRNYLYSGFASGAGYLLENRVYLELRAHGYEVHVGVWGGREVDFVASKGDSRFYVQVCQTLADEATAEREFAPLRAIRDNHPKVVVSLDDIPFSTPDGIASLPAWELHARL